MAKPSWISISKTSGTGNGTSNVTAASHTGRTKRSGSILSKTTGNASVTTPVEQAGANEFINASLGTVNIAALGGTTIISGTSNCGNLKLQSGSQVISGVTAILKVNEVLVEDWDGINNLATNAGEDKSYNFEIILTIPENKSETIKHHLIKISNADAVLTEQFDIIQAAGVKTYSEISIRNWGYSQPFPAKGGTFSPDASKVELVQTWGWNGNLTNGGNVDSSEFTIEYSGVSKDPVCTVGENGEFTIASLGTTVKNTTTVVTATITVISHEKTATDSKDLVQEANSATYGEVTVTSAVTEDIPASGGSRASATVVASQTITYTSTATRTIDADDMTITYGSAVTASTLGTTVKARTQVGLLAMTVAGEGTKAKTQNVPVYQAANAVTNWGTIAIGLSTPQSIIGEGETKSLSPQFTRKRTYTSGAVDSADYLDDITYQVSIKTPVDGFSVDSVDETYNAGDTFDVIVTENPGITQRGPFVITISANATNGSLSASKDISFTQQNLESYIRVTPTTLVFEYTGGTKVLNIESNDSWTIS